MKRQTYQQLLDELTDGEHWLFSLGFTRQANRIHTHISNIRRLEVARQAGTINELLKTLKDTLPNSTTTGGEQLGWSLIEASEFVDIFSGLRNYTELSLLQDKLREALKGPLHPGKEKSSTNTGRNITFELNLASRLYRKGVPVYLGLNPDVLCTINQRSVYLQCKRPFYESNISTNIFRARRQLTRDLNSSRHVNPRGVIAISVSRVLNPGNKIAVAETEYDLNKQLGDYIQELAEGHFRTSWKSIVDIRILGILFHAITVGIVKDTNLLVAAQQLVMCSPPAYPTSDKLLLRDLLNLLRGEHAMAV